MQTFLQRFKKEGGGSGVIPKKNPIHGHKLSETGNKDFNIFLGTTGKTSSDMLEKPVINMSDYNSVSNTKPTPMSSVLSPEKKKPEPVSGGGTSLEDKMVNIKIIRIIGAIKKTRS